MEGWYTQKKWKKIDDVVSRAAKRNKGEKTREGKEEESSTTQCYVTIVVSRDRHTCGTYLHTRLHTLTLHLRTPLLLLWLRPSANLETRQRGWGWRGEVEAGRPRSLEERSIKGKERTNVYYGLLHTRRFSSGRLYFTSNHITQPQPPSSLRTERQVAVTRCDRESIVE